MSVNVMYQHLSNTAIVRLHKVLFMGKLQLHLTFLNVIGEFLEARTRVELV